MPIRIVCLDYDYWHMIAEADGELDVNETPSLNIDGNAYYLCFRPDWEEGQSFWPDSVGYMSEAEAKADAERRVPTPINWIE